MNFGGGLFDWKFKVLVSVLRVGIDRRATCLLIRVKLRVPGLT
jgi:hypothetical protein